MPNPEGSGIIALKEINNGYTTKATALGRVLSVIYGNFTVIHRSVDVVACGVKGLALTRGQQLVVERTACLIAFVVATASWTPTTVKGQSCFAFFAVFVFQKKLQTVVGRICLTCNFQNFFGNHRAYNEVVAWINTVSAEHFTARAVFCCFCHSCKCLKLCATLLQR